MFTKQALLRQVLMILKADFNSFQIPLVKVISKKHKLQKW